MNYRPSQKQLRERHESNLRSLPTTFSYVPGNVRKHIHHLLELMNKTSIRDVILFCRVSSDPQKTNGNLNESVREARATLERLGFQILRVVADVEPSGLHKDRPLLRYAARLARKHGALLVAPSRDRLLRHHAFGGRNALERPTAEELKEFSRLCHGVMVATLLDPEQCSRSSQIKRGHAAKGDKGGRPAHLSCGPGFSKRRQAALITQAKKFRGCGLTYRQIADRLNDGRAWPDVCYKTVWNWVNLTDADVV